MLLQIHRSPPQPQKIKSWWFALFLCFMEISQLLMRPWKALLPYENYSEEVRKHHVVFFECTLQNFLLLQNNSLDKISQGKSQPSWSFSETGTCHNQLQTQQPHWSPIHFSKWSLMVCFWARSFIKGAEFRSTYFSLIYCVFSHSKVKLFPFSESFSLLIPPVTSIQGWKLPFTCPT